MQGKSFDDWAGQVYGAKSDEELTRKYDTWAADYDRDVESVGYRSPALAAGLFGRYVPADAGEGDEASEGDGGGSREARLVVFGDADFASNELIEAYRNRDLFLNTVNWLLGDVEAISIRPVRSRASRFQLSGEQFQRIRTLSLLVLPEALAVIGVLVWWSRRQT